MYTTYVLYRLSMRHYVWTEHSDGHKVQRQHNVPSLVIRMGCKQNAGGHAWSTLVACMNTKYRVCSCIKLSVHISSIHRCHMQLMPNCMYGQAIQRWEICQCCQWFPTIIMSHEGKHTCNNWLLLPHLGLTYRVMGVISFDLSITHWYQQRHWLSPIALL